MDLEALDAALRASLEDLRVTRGERKALRALLEEHDLDAHGRALLRARAFALAAEQLEHRPQAKAVLAWLEDVVGLVAPLEGPRAGAGSETPEVGAWFSPGEAPLLAIVSQMRRVRRSADICVFTITDDRLSDGILGLVRRGVRVRVVSDDDKAGDLGSDLRRLREGGVEVATDRSEAHMHHKFALFDDARLLTGSFNWTRSATGANHENVLVTTDAVLVRAYREEFERLWSRYA